MDVPTTAPAVDFRPATRAPRRARALPCEVHSPENVLIFGDARQVLDRVRPSVDRDQPFEQADRLDEEALHQLEVAIFAVESDWAEGELNRSVVGGDFPLVERLGLVPREPRARERDQPVADPERV